jgi:hypothetical protein
LRKLFALQHERMVNRENTVCERGKAQSAQKIVSRPECGWKPKKMNGQLVDFGEFAFCR